MPNRLFAIGDIHGCFNSFQNLIENHLTLEKNDLLILLGDYIDRGPNSKEVINYILELQSQGYNITPLMGNHEAMLLEAITSHSKSSSWIQNGGDSTLSSFGVKQPIDIAENYIHFFSNLPYFHSIDEYLFVHAGFNDSILNPFEDTNTMLRQSSEQYNHPQLANRTIIHGHRPTEISHTQRQIQLELKVINIDTGCVYRNSKKLGRLTAIELPSKCLISI